MKKENNTLFDLREMEKSNKNVWLAFVKNVILERHGKVDVVIQNWEVKHQENNVVSLRANYDLNAKRSGDVDLHIDEFGARETKYIDFASECFRGDMSNHFGKEYDAAVEKKLGKPFEPDAN